MAGRFGDMGTVLDRYFTDALKLAKLYIGGEMSDEEFEKNRESLSEAFVGYSVRYGDEGGQLVNKVFDIAYGARKAAKTPEELARIKAAFSIDQDQGETLCGPFE